MSLTLSIKFHELYHTAVGLQKELGVELFRDVVNQVCLFQQVKILKSHRATKCTIQNITNSSMVRSRPLSSEFHEDSIVNLLLDLALNLL